MSDAAEARRAKIRDDLERGLLNPFQDILIRHLDTVGDDSDLRAYGKKTPDRHAQAVAIYAKLAGFGTTQEIKISGSVEITAKTMRSLADAQLMSRLDALMTQLRAMPATADVVDAEPVALKGKRKA